MTFWGPWLPLIHKKNMWLHIGILDYTDSKAAKLIWGTKNFQSKYRIKHSFLPPQKMGVMFTHFFCRNYLFLSVQSLVQPSSLFRLVFHWSGGGGKGGFKNDSYEAAAASLINTPGRPVAHTPFVAAMFGIGGDVCWGSSLVVLEVFEFYCGLLYKTPIVTSAVLEMPVLFSFFFTDTKRSFYSRSYILQASSGWFECSTTVGFVSFFSFAMLSIAHVCSTLHLPELPSV